MDLYEFFKNKFETSSNFYELMVTKHDEKIIVEWVIDFRKNTRVKVFNSNKNLIACLNSDLIEIANEYKDQLITLYLCSLESCVEFDHWDEKNPDSSFEHDEKCIGGFVELKNISL